MTDRWKAQIAQLNLDMMEVRLAKADAIKRVKEVSAELHHTRIQSRDQSESHNKQIRSLQEQHNAIAAELASAKSKIEQLSVEIVDYQTALRHRSETEQTLREFLRGKENELLLKEERAEQYSNTLQREISQLSDENKTLRAALTSEQRASTKAVQDLEISQNQVISLHSQIAKMKAEIGVLRSNWQTERSRVLQLDNGQVSSIVREREQLKSRVEYLESKVTSAELSHNIINELETKSSTLSKELHVLKAALEAKDNIISEMDSQLSTLHNQLKEKSEHIQGQNSLIEDLYKRLRYSEDGPLQRSSQKEACRDALERDERSDQVGLYEIWKDLDVVLTTINSISGNRLHSQDAAKAHDHEPTPAACDLIAVQEIASQLRRQVASAAAEHIGDSCVMQ